MQNNLDITKNILKCCFEVMNELGSGFLELVYKNSLVLALVDEGWDVQTDKCFNVTFRNRAVGLYVPDLIVEETVIVELKVCDHLLSEHKAQLINYLKVADIPIGLLVNFGKRKLEYNRLYHPMLPPEENPFPTPFNTPYDEKIS